mmetsp:Transcript_89875/g.268132  ORF Transcript_89875/g.268132 Transcript_89875/m.268132 type:complete len:367 (-) Transcript_89875:33-1133(-)
MCAHTSALPQPSPHINGVEILNVVLLDGVVGLHLHAVVEEVQFLAPQAHPLGRRRHQHVCPHPLLLHGQLHAVVLPVNDVHAHAVRWQLCLLLRLLLLGLCGLLLRQLLQAGLLLPLLGRNPLEVCLPGGGKLPGNLLRLALGPLLLLEDLPPGEPVRPLHRNLPGQFLRGGGTGAVFLGHLLLPLLPLPPLPHLLDLRRTLRLLLGPPRSHGLRLGPLGRPRGLPRGLPLCPLGGLGLTGEVRLSDRLVEVGLRSLREVSLPWPQRGGCLGSLLLGLLRGSGRGGGRRLRLRRRNRRGLTVALLPVKVEPCRPGLRLLRCAAVEDCRGGFRKQRLQQQDSETRASQSHGLGQGCEGSEIPDQGGA